MSDSIDIYRMTSSPPPKRKKKKKTKKKKKPKKSEFDRITANNSIVLSILTKVTNTVNNINVFGWLCLWPFPQNLNYWTCLIYREDCNEGKGIKLFTTATWVRFVGLPEINSSLLSVDSRTSGWVITLGEFLCYKSKMNMDSCLIHSSGSFCFRPVC